MRAPKRRRVLMVIDSLGRGGAERLLVTTLTHLDRTRFEVTVAVLFGPNPMAEAIRAKGIEVEELGLAGPKDLLSAVWKLRRLIRDGRFHVVHTHLFSANVAGRIAASGVACVITTLHNPDYGCEGPSHGFSARRLVDGGTAHLLRPSYLAVSRDVKDDYGRQLAIDGIEVLYNYMDVEQLQRDVQAVEGDRVRRDLGLAPDSFVVLNVGRLHAQKGHDVLLQAFAALARRRPRCRLVLAGEGPIRGQIESEAKALGLDEEVLFLGSVRDPVELYAAADAFAFPSRYEAFGMALLEAMGAGLPSVVSRVGGIVEVTSEASSILVRPGDSESFFQALSVLEGDPSRCRRLGEEARLRAASFDVSIWLPKLERIYAAA